MDHRTDKELATAAAAGDVDARNAFIERHMGLIHFHCGRICGLDAEEFIADAVEYVCERLERYEGKVNPKTAAFNFLPHRLQERRQQRWSVIETPQRPHTDRLRSQTLRAHLVRSLDRPFRDDGRPGRESSVEVKAQEIPQRMDDRTRLEWLMFAVGQLEDREQRILFARMRGVTLEQVGKELGITKERVRQIQSLAMAALRKLAESA